ncbi:MAG TPA: PAS domain S-box protein [Gallionella sp.]|nr:PAS domain S-box protein [Gallionella sp.]
MVDQLTTIYPSYPGKAKLAAKLLLVALVYFASGRLGLAIPYVDTHITLIWLPTGIALAALMRWGYNCWPGIFMGALATNYSVDGNPLLDGCIALGNTLAPLLATKLLRRFEFHEVLDRAYDILLLVAAAAIGMLVSASIGVGSLALFKMMTLPQAGASWLAWWAGDFIGVLMAAPLLLNVSRVELKKLWAQRVEFLAWFSILLAVSWHVFLFVNVAGSHSEQLVFLLLPLVVWSAMRFGVMGSSLGVLIPAMIAAVATGFGLGPFYTEDVRQGLFFLLLFFATLVLVDLMVAALQAGRKHAEEAARLESDLSKELIQSLPGIFYMFDATGRFLMWNRQFESVLRIDSDEIARSNPLDFFEGSDRELIAENIRRVFEIGDTEVDAVLVAKNGARMNYHFTGHRIERDGEQVLVGVGLDITERHKTQTETANLLRRYQTLMNSALDGIRVMDINGNVVEANDSFCRMLGYTHEEALKLNVADWDAQWTKEELLERLKRFIGKSGATFETVQRRKDGSLIDVEVSTTGVEVEGQNYFFASSRDITERKRAEKKNEVLMRRYQTLMKSTLEGIHIMDEVGNVVEVNDTFCRMLGYTQDEMARLNVADWDAQWSKDELMERFRMLIKIDGALFETRHRRKDGSVFDVEVSTTGAEIDGRHFLYASSRDITERKSSEAKLQRLMQLYAALNQCNQSIVRCNSEQELFEQVCRDAVHFGGIQMAWIGLVDGPTRSIRPVASFGTGREYLEDIEISVEAGEPSGQGPTGTAVRENHPVWIQDFQNDPHLAPWHERGARAGWAASASLPLHRNGVVIGTLNLYSAVAHAFDEAARNLLVGMVTDISYALTRFELLAERSEAEDAMRIAAVTFETQEAILITDPDGNILRVNHAFEEITGYSAEEVIGKNPRMFQSGRHDAGFFRSMWSALLGTGKWAGEVWDKRKDGEVYPKLMTITATYDEADQVTNYVAVFRDISNRKKSEQEIHQLAFYDSLTKLPNRRLLLDRLQQGLAISARNGRHGALLFLDMDHFKNINDTQGHAKGDELLIEVARRLHTCVREGDSVARLGGDEFVVVLEDLSTDADEAATQTELVADKIRVELDKPYVMGDYEFHSTVSIGISLFFDHRESVEDLLRHADVAMYQAKMSGRNAIRFFDPHMQMALEARAAMEADLRRALEKQQFHLCYQVQVDSLRRPLGAEVLLRWVHPERGDVPPTQFIPLAEETGLIVPIGLWVLKTACAQLKEWQSDARTRDLVLSVNVSAKQFRQPDFVAQAQRILMESGAKPSHLKMEFTESTVLENVEDAISRMRELKILGVGFSVDDFGTGYSSLQYLKRLPLDQIKIDQSFVRDIVSDPNDAAIVQTIIAMTEALGLNVIAEGVETMAQFEFLDNHGCHAFQGYLFSIPLPLDQFESVLRGEIHSSRHSSALP